MAATVLNKSTWTDDTGTPASPANDGTIIGNAELQNDIYAPVQEVLDNDVTFGGVINSDGAGQSEWTASTNAGHGLLLRNTNSGSSANGTVWLGNDTSATMGLLQVFSSGWGSTGSYRGDGMIVRCTGAGGITVASEHASGEIRFINNFLEKAVVDIDGFDFVKAPNLQEAAPATPDISRLYTSAGIIAWARVTNSGTPTLVDSYNVTSLTDGGTGKTQVNFISNAPDANYAPIATLVTPGAADAVFTNTPLVGSFVVETERSAVDTDMDFTVVVIGNLV